MSRLVEYRNVRGTPSRLSKLSQLENDLNVLSRGDIIRLIQESRSSSVTSVNGLTGAVTVDIPSVRKMETFLGVTDSSGNFRVTYSVPYASAPHVQPVIVAGTASQSIRVTSSSTTGFTVNVTNRASVTLLAIEVLLAATTPVNGASVSVQVTAR